MLAASLGRLYTELNRVFWRQQALTDVRAGFLDLCGVRGICLLEVHGASFGLAGALLAKPLPRPFLGVFDMTVARIDSSCPLISGGSGAGRRL